MTPFFLILTLSLSTATVYFKETFDGEYSDDWVSSAWKEKMGEWKSSSGAWYVDEAVNKGLQTQTDMGNHAISAKFPSFSNRGKDLVLQFSVKHEEHKYAFCGGGYLKLIPAGLDQTKFGGDDAYSIMFGPDLCGYDVSRIHFILNHKGENLLKKDEIKLEYSDKNEFTHLYTMVLHPDNTYEVYFDLEEKAKGNIVDEWDFPKKEIDDPEDKKPEDWVEEAKMDDPDAKKPDGYDDIKEKIVDPEAVKPEEWDDEDDGEWEPTMIDNPDFKGEWKAEQVDNPDYKGPWAAKKIANPDYIEDVYAFEDLQYVGIEVWTVNKGSIFDNIFIGDSFEEAKAFGEETWKPTSEKEKEAKEAYDNKNKEEEKKDEDEVVQDEDVVAEDEVEAEDDKPQEKAEL